MKKTIYLDNAAGMCVDESVVREMNKFQTELYGNPSSVHTMGEEALKAITEARKKVAEEIGAHAQEIVFTSGATESLNLAFFGLTKSKLAKKRKKIIVSSIEHSCIQEICEEIKKRGFKIVEVGVNNAGRINLDELSRKIDKNTLLVNVMHVNNELGVTQDIEQIGKICRGMGVLFHSDCSQSFGKIKIDVKKMNLDMLSASSYKIGGPKGVGFLYVREDVELEPIIYGGGQERGLRGGTENVPGIVGFVKALELTKKTNKKKISLLRKKLIEGLSEIGASINSPDEDSIPTIINFSFEGIDSENLVYWLSNKNIMISTGSACDSKSEKQNKVLREIGLTRAEIEGSVRITINDRLSEKDIDYVVSEIGKFVSKNKVKN